MKVGDIKMDGQKIGWIDLATLEDDAALPGRRPDVGSDMIGPGIVDIGSGYRSPGGGGGYRSRGGSGPYPGKPGPDTDTHESRDERRHRPDKQPTFRPGLTPRGKAPIEQPEHFSTGDVARALSGRGKGIDRSAYREELAHNPALREKILRIAENEQGGHPEGTQAVIESLMNRAQMRGTSLAAQARWTSEGGYYKNGSMGAGLRDPRTRAIIEKGLDAALSGSNISNFATDNSSGAFARGEIASKKFLFRSTFGGEYFTSPGWGEARYRDVNYPRWLAQAQQGAPTDPHVVTRLGPDPNYRPPAEAGTTPAPGGPVAPGDVSPRAPIAPGATPSATGPPAAFIIHHTNGGGTPKDVMNTLRQRGLSVEYIMDREGNIVRYGPPGAANIKPETGPAGTALGHQLGLTNKNIVGMEVIARNDRDVNAKQVEAAKRFIRENYPRTPVYGHGEIQRDKEPDEGRTIVSAIRAERSRLAAQPSTAVSQPSTAPARPPETSNSVTYAPHTRENPGSTPVTVNYGSSK